VKNKIILVLILVIGLLVTGCSGADTTQPETTQPAAEKLEEVVTLTEPIAESPVALTSAGQSADVKMIESLIKKTDMEYIIDNVMTVDTMGDAKTLILAIGGSSKGLGAAGINTEEELDRIATLIAKAKENNMTIIGMHVGGEGRRGELSDKFVVDTVPLLDYFVYVESGNKDNLLSDLANENGVPSESVESIAASFEALKKAFK
jgi:hypothetical protein